MQKEKISLIIPMYNPPVDWFELFPYTLNSLQQTFPDNLFEIIFIDDGSSVPVKIPDKYFFSVILLRHNINKGKGAAIRNGLQNTQSNFYLLTDIDLPYSTESIIKIIKQLKTGNDIVFGYRDRSEIKKSPPARRIISFIYGWWIKNILRYPVGDTQCGLKGMNEKGKEIFLKTSVNTFLYDLEFMKMVLKSTAIKYCFEKVQLRPDVQFSRMSFKILMREWMNLVKIIFRK